MQPAVVFPARAHDIEWSERHRLLYLSLPASNGPSGNVVVALDPYTNRILHSHPAGSEPGEMALSDDQQYLHVVSNGTSTVQRFRLPELTLEREFFLGRDDLGLPYLANDIVAVPGQPKSVVVAMGIDSWLPQPHWVRVYDDGAPRPIELGTVTGGNCWSLGWDATGTRLYCAQTSTTGHDFQEAALSADGLRVIRSKSGVFSHFYARMHFSARTGLVYGSDGTVFDPSSERVLTRIEASGAMVPDPLRNRLYYASSSSATVRGFAADTFAPMGQAMAASSQPTRMVRWGDNGLALATADNTTLLFGGSGTSSFGSATPHGSATERIVRTEVNQLVWDPVSARLYASIGSRAAGFADSIAVIEPFSGRITHARSVGSEPNALAVSDDGQYLYAGIDGEGAVHRLRLPSLDAELVISLGLDRRLQPYTAGAIRPAPSRPTTIAVVRFAPMTLPHEIGGIVVFDGDLPRPSISQDHPQWGYPLYHFDAVWNADGSLLHSLSLFSDLYTLGVSDLGLSLAAERAAINSVRSALRFDKVNRLLSIDGGNAVDAQTNRPVGRYRPAHNIGAQNVAIDTAGAQVFVLAPRRDPPLALEITAYDARRFVPLKTYSIAGSDTSITWDFVQLRPGWFAFRSVSGVHIIQLDP